MKPFHEWVADMSNSIEDASTVSNQEQIEATPAKKTFAEKYDELYQSKIAQKQYEDYCDMLYDDYLE